MNDSQRGKLAAFAIAAVIAPVALISGYLVCAHHFHVGSGTTDYVALLTATALGAPFVWLLPLTLRHRLRLLVGYIPMTLLLLTFYMLLFVGMAFDDWL